MKFDLHDPAPEESNSSAPASPGCPAPAPAEEFEVGGVKSRYGRAIDSTLSSLSQLRAHVAGRPAPQEPLGRDDLPFDGEDSAQALFRPDLFSGRTGGGR
ncbi:hypothetical protein GCM10007079_06030 [Nocardiopsis terrae]|uniref:Uncharacterized protein n=1 Tax=Nocardiopsis terrae TaxID=372655 RepID=A0ABR9HNT7_9ACTN|nr:hypothetical protein [Nocardiopsis terrae]MBE1460651.1 hypothetical protein [Nocardiopsis terrae]GHC72660.1 hypothetical protein GCM10007079_06030 [Nocardiopsis terrae]